MGKTTAKKTPPGAKKTTKTPAELARAAEATRRCREKKKEQDDKVEAKVGFYEAENPRLETAIQNLKNFMEAARNAAASTQHHRQMQQNNFFNHPPPPPPPTNGTAY